MKKYLFFAAAAIAALVSCNKEIATEEVLAPKQGYKEITLTAEVGTDTKASLDGKKVIWEKGEQVAVFTTASTSPETFSVKEVEGTTVTITGAVPASATSFIAAYPYKNAVSCTDGVVKMIVKDTQTVGESGVDGEALNSVAYFETVDAAPTFKNTLALVKFTVGSEGVKKIKIAADQKGALGGSVAVTVTNSEGALAEPAIAAAEKAAVVVENEAGFVVGKTYYAAVSPGEYTGFYVTSYVGGDIKLKSTDKAGTIARNATLDLGDVTTGSAVVDMITGITNAEELQFFLSNAPKYDADVTVKVLNDIDLTGVTLTGAKSFKGTLDGQGFSLKNWTGTEPLFATISGKLTNLVVDETCSFAPAGNIFGVFAAESEAELSKLVNKAPVTFSRDANCTAPVLLAGIVGASKGAVSDCENWGAVTMTVAGSVQATGVAGIAALQAAPVTGCINKGALSHTANYTGTKNAPYKGYSKAVPCMGGIVAYGYQGVVIKGCENAASVTFQHNTIDKIKSNMNRHFVAGIIGASYGLVEDCNNSGNITAIAINSVGNKAFSTYEYIIGVGGIAGGDYYTPDSENLSDIVNCTNSGNVDLQSNSTGSNSTCAGIFSWPGSEAPQTHATKGCVNTGKVSLSKRNVKARVGGIQAGTGNMENCKNTGDIEISRCSNAAQVGGLGGFHANIHYLRNCEVDCKITYTYSSYLSGVGGLVGNLGVLGAHSIEKYTMFEGCKVNFKYEATQATGADAEKTVAGIVIGTDKAASITATYGSPEAPMQLKGSIKLTANSEVVEVNKDNYTEIFAGNKAEVGSAHTLYVDFPDVLAFERVIGWYSSASALWTNSVTGVSITHPDGYGMARGIAMDDEYIYLPKASGYANVAAVSIADPTQQKALKMTGVSGGSTFATSFVRVLKNNDASVNGGKDVLLLCNLTETNSDANQLRLYAYKDGVDAAPTQIAGFCWDGANSVNDWRRYGDRFSVSGDWSGARVYFPSFNANKIVALDIANGARTAVVQMAAGAANSPDGIKDLTVYPGSTSLFLSNASIANLVAPTGGLAGGWNEYSLSGSSEKGKGTFGYNFFKLNGKSYIAYARLSGQKAWIEVIKDKGDLLSSLEAQEGLIKSPIHSADNLDAEFATGGVADCCVREIGGVVYVAALTRDGGMVLDKLVVK